MEHNKELLSFFESNGRKLFLYLLKMTANRSDAEDIYQETFLKYASAYPDRRSTALLFTVARSVFLDSVKRSDRTVELSAELPSGTSGPEDAAIQREKESRLRDALEKLPDDDRELLAMAGPEGLSYKEIAVVKSMTESNVKVRVHRTRQKLRQLLEADND